jgi:protein-S-isoprenylcysteine O-methyltransferase Ste14
MRPFTYAVSASLLILGAVVVFRAFVRQEYQRRGRLGLWGSALEWLIFSLLGYFIYLDSIGSWPPPELGSLQGALGWTLITVGLGATVVIIAWFGFGRACGLEVSGLVQTGPYRVTRNPQVLACGAAVIGYALFWPSWHSAGWVVLYAALAHLMVLTEEEHLRSVHGDAYVRYCERIPRYVAARRR